MTDEYTPVTQETRIKQHRNLLVFVGCTMILGSAIWYFMDDNSSNEMTRKKEEAIPFSGPAEKISAQLIWMERAQIKLKEQERKTIELKNEITQIKNGGTTKSAETDPQFQTLQRELQNLKEMINNKTSTQAQPVSGGKNYSGDVFSTPPGARIYDPARSIEAAGIDNNILNLKSSHYSPRKNPDTFVPAGTFAEAIMLGAADASAGVQSQANPSPMLFRIIADGNLPNHKKSHLKNCVVTAAVVGDISSERGQIRLERISCTFPNGEIVEQQVEGTIFGMDAKNGVRGNPVWREGALLGRAAVAGTLSGLGNAISQTYTTTSISPLGSTQTVNNAEIFKYGAAQGALSAMEKLAEYNIRRAEQYHPVIQLSAGQPVDVVFLKGFYLDGRTHDENNADDKSESPQLFPGVRQTMTGLTLSESELERIKQHEQHMGWIGKGQSGGMQ